MCEYTGNNSLVLASASPRRSLLLSQMNLDFDVFPAQIDEITQLGKPPEEECVRIAQDKAIWTAARLPHGKWVLSADTIVVVDGYIFGKPRDAAEAEKMLAAIAGRKHRVITGWCIMKSPAESLRSGFVESGVVIKALDKETIRAYVRTGEPMDKAGAYAVQGIGAFMVSAIYGSYTNVVGLPLCEVIDALEDVGAIKMF